MMIPPEKNNSRKTKIIQFVSLYLVQIIFALCGFVILFYSIESPAKTLLPEGEIYPIQEMDLLDFLQLRIKDMQQNGQWEKLQNKVKRNTEHYRDRPTAVFGIQKAKESKSWFWDPSITLDHDVVTPTGIIIARKNTHVNPLHYVSLTKTLIFYDADDKEQVRWVEAFDQKIKGKDKLILVKGSLLLEEKRFQKKIYFDQEGRLTRRFNIQHVPVTVLQEGKKLRIREIKMQ